jgi:membrane-associated protein
MFNVIDFILHIDLYVNQILLDYGFLAYPLFFLIIFLETGLVITPFLPGDSLLFILGTFSAKGSLNIGILFVLLSIAAILGDTVNYFMGKFFGEKVFSRFVKRSYLDKTKDFYKKYGSKTIILARFVPIIRTFAPFVAGVGKMNYSKFIVYNVIGGLAWICLFLFGGYFFGSIPLIEKNLSLVTILIIIISIIPIIIEIIKSKLK